MMQELDTERTREVLSQNHLCHLGMARDGHAYVLPIFYAYDGVDIFFHSHPGLKEEFLRGTKESCLVVTRVLDEDSWESVQVFGRLEKVTVADEIQRGMEALLRIPLPPEFGVSAQGEPRRTGQNMFIWRLRPVRISGRASEHPPGKDDIGTV